MAFGREMVTHWMLDPSVTYLNHGTVGAVPRRVLDAQQAIRDDIERRPAQFLLREVATFAGRPRREPTRLREAADHVAAFIGASGRDVVFVDNATTGVNAVLRSIVFEPDDEILLTDHNYEAVRMIARFVARERALNVRVVEVPYPEFERQRLIDAVSATIGPRTRLAVFDHITSESALIFPIAELAAVCRSRGVAVLVDGAHAPGTLPLNVPSLGVDWYVGNLHKWAYAPRSCGFLWAHPARQSQLHPPVISWGYEKGFTAEFDWVGTRDPSPWLAAPAALAFLHELGLDRIRRYNHDLAWRAARQLTERWGTNLFCDEPSIGSMVSVPVPAALGTTAESATSLRDELLEVDHIEVQVHAMKGRIWVRVSAQIYNDLEDIDRLSEVVARRTGLA
jgi:isopenicillin-N epimerase